MDWLSDGALVSADCGNPYDIVCLPGFEFGIEHPETAYQTALLARFPAQPEVIEYWIEEMRQVRRAVLTPPPGACCVFCSYGTLPCPPIQVQRDGEPGAHGGCCG